MNGDDEIRLFRRWLDHDDEAARDQWLEYVQEPLERAVCRMLWRRPRSFEVEDVCQETLRRLINMASHGRLHVHGRPSRYAIGIAFCVLVDFIREEHRRRESERHKRPDTEADPLDEAKEERRKALRGALAAAIQHLPDTATRPLRSVFELHMGWRALGGELHQAPRLSRREVLESLGRAGELHESRVSQWLTEAKSRLRRDLAEWKDQF